MAIWTIGSVATLTGTPAQIVTFLQGKNGVFDIEVVYSGTAGSFTAFVVQDTNN
jgi:hypothetical protein